MNLQELGAVTTILSAGVAGGIAGHEDRSGFTAILGVAAGAVTGLLVGSLVAWLGDRFVYAPLTRASFRASPRAEFFFLALDMILFMLSPLAGVGATLGLTLSIARLLT